ncbi:hypothetical protein CEQ30_18395 [Nocardia brasiliensis]|nr:hypothetical protein CEQ30_18395 [Nocardia brasiliensis]
MTAVLGLVVGCGPEKTIEHDSPYSFTVSGTLRVHDDATEPWRTRLRSGCLHAGELLWVTTGSGDRVLALSQLGTGAPVPGQHVCEYALTVHQVPIGVGVYQISLPAIAASKLFTEPELRTGVDIDFHQDSRN